MFKTTFKTLAMALVACLATVSFTACGGDDDPEVPPTKTATEAYIENTVYTTALTLKYCKVEATDFDGNTIELTADNCTEADAFPDDVYKSNMSLLNLKSYGDKWMKYEMKKQTYKSFPTKQYTFSATITPKADAAPEGSFSPQALPVVKVTNNMPGGTAWDSLSGSVLLTVTGGMAWDKYVERWPVKKTSIDVRLDGADKLYRNGLIVSNGK